MPADNVAVCPQCQTVLSFVASWTCRGHWGYDEISTYECPEHGPMFIGPATAAGRAHHQSQDTGQDNRDPEALVPAPRKPAPTLNAGAIAIPEPE